jgi:hypothetical protein
LGVTSALASAKVIPLLELTPAVATLVGAAVALLGVVVAQFVTFRNERHRWKQEYELAAQKAGREFDDARREALRTAAAGYASTAVHEVDLASALMKDPSQAAPTTELLQIHTRLRTEYEALLLLSESIATQRAAREVLRVAWNERQEGLGLERKRPRDPGVAPAKHLRRCLRDFTREVRQELGLSPELVVEPED